MPALKFVMNIPSFFGLPGTIQDLLASIFMNDNSQKILTVSPDKTEVDWKIDGTNTIMTGTGINLKANGGDLKKGKLVDVEFTGSNFNMFSMQLFGLNVKAADLQTTIDNILNEQATNGETVQWTYDEFVARTFDIRPQIVIGDDQSNTIRGGDKDDKLKGGLGNDLFLATLGNDTINGGDGDSDRLVYNGVVGVGDIVADLGANSITLGDGSVQVVRNVPKLAAGDGNDALTGDQVANTLEGNGGNDVISGKSGDDVLNGGGGEDTILGNSGDDFILGGDGNDSIEGGAGDDEILGDDGKDTIYGGTDNDLIMGGANKDSIIGGSGNDSIFGGGSGDSIKGGEGEDDIDGGKGDDTLDGGKNADEIKGGVGNDIIFGGNGYDRISGNAGDDELNGDAGNDTLFGGRGNDEITGNEGNDDLTGGIGADEFRFFVIDGLPDYNGHDDILDFETGDVIKLFYEQIADIGTTPSGPGILLTYGSGSIQLHDVTLPQLSFVQDGSHVLISIM